MALIGVLTHHWAQEDKVEEAKALLDRNGEASEPRARIWSPSHLHFAGRPHQDLDPGHLGEQRDLRRLARQSRTRRCHGRRG